MVEFCKSVMESELAALAYAWRKSLGLPSSTRASSSKTRERAFMFSAVVRRSKASRLSIFDQRMLSLYARVLTIFTMLSQSNRRTTFIVRILSIDATDECRISSSSLVVEPVAMDQNSWGRAGNFVQSTFQASGAWSTRS